MAVVIIDSSRSKYSGICMHALGQIACVDLSVCHCKVAYLCKKKTNLQVQDYKKNSYSKGSVFRFRS
jgi:hypothetical protein